TRAGRAVAARWIALEPPRPTRVGRAARTRSLALEPPRDTRVRHAVTGGDAREPPGHTRVGRAARAGRAVTARWLPLEAARPGGVRRAVAARGVALEAPCQTRRTCDVHDRSARAAPGGAVCLRSEQRVHAGAPAVRGRARAWRRAGGRGP